MIMKFNSGFLAFLTIGLIASIPLITNQSCSNNNEEVIPTTNYRLASKAYFEDGKQDSALAIVNRQLTEYPKDVDSRYIKAKILTNRGEYNQALTELDYILKIYKGNHSIYKSTVYSLKALIYDQLKDYAQSAEYYKKAYKQARKDSPDMVHSYMLDYAQALNRNNDQEGAERFYNQMIKQNGKDCEAMLSLARTMIEKNELGKALQLLDKVQAIDATIELTYRYKSIIFWSQGENHKCIDAVTEYYKISDDTDYRLIDFFLLDYSYSIPKLKSVINDNVNSDMFELILAEVYYKHGDYARALDLYKTIEQKYGDDKTILWNQSRCYFRMKDFENALTQLNKVISISSDPEYLANRAALHARFGKFKEAIKYYKEILENSPDDPDILYSIGHCYLKQGNITAALEYFNRGLEVDSTHTKLLLNRGDLLKSLGRTEEAYRDYNNILAIDTDIQYYGLRHYALQALGRNDEAIDWIDRFIELYPGDNANYFEKACIYFRMGDTDKALETLELAFQQGFHDFLTIEVDTDLDPFRHNPRFTNLIKTYKQNLQDENDKADRAEL